MNNNTKSPLSDRASALLKASIRPDVDLIIEAFGNAFDEKENPDGCLILNIAENKLSAGIIREYVHELITKKNIPDWVSYYTFPNGHPDFLASFSKFYAQFVSGTELNLNGLACSCGITAVIELSSMILGDDGDCVVFPAPAYPAYTADIGFKAGLERVNLKLLDHETGIRKSISNEVLNALNERIQNESKNFKMLVLTHPDNPTGVSYSEVELELAAKWCHENKVHLVVNEVYALSGVLDEPYFSFSKIINREKSPYLHLWYGLSKDFSSSGYRVGFLYSQNLDFIKVYANMNGPHMVSGITQWIFSELLSDMDFLSTYIDNNKRSLVQTHQKLTGLLDELNLPYLTFHSPFFLWIDFSRFLPLFSTEKELWEAIFRESNILVTPGEGFGHDIKAWFRLIYTCLTEEAMPFFERRFSKLIHQWDEQLTK